MSLNKQLVETAEMVDRIQSGTEAKGDTDFIMARTDALASEGLSAAIERAKPMLLLVPMEFLLRL